MRLYHTTQGIIVEWEEQFYQVLQDWDSLVNRDQLHDSLAKDLKALVPLKQAPDILESGLLPPIGHQEIWAAGVTYTRSLEARKEESRDSGGANFYDLVYHAPRPELFFKSTAHRAVGSGQPVKIRSDSSWNVPEPELTLFINSFGNIQGFTIGNDLSSRSIEGENPLYLPQAKMYEGSASIGPCLYVPSEPLFFPSLIGMQIFREGQPIFDESVPISRMKRTPQELVSWLYRAFHFPVGAYLMTGTCLVPENGFTLLEGDSVHIRIDPIGCLINPIEVLKVKIR
ncbi:MAG: fumarylacetoacetate hydrolase family protein [Chitinophagaceae bacterium]